MKAKALRRLRWMGLAEGMSFLLLLGVAMPLKYIWGMPMAVRVVGMAHGLLFTAYVFMTLRAVSEDWLDKPMGIRMALASVVPLGPFLVDRPLQRLIESADEEASPAP